MSQARSPQRRKRPSSLPKRFLRLRVELAGDRMTRECGHASARHWLCGVISWHWIWYRLHRRECWRIRPTGTWQARTGSGSSAARGTTGRNAAPCRAPAGNGTPDSPARDGPSRSTGHGTASGTTYCRTAATGRTAHCCAATELPPCSAVTAASGDSAPGATPHHRAVAAEHTARGERAADAATAGRNPREPARAIDPATTAGRAGAAARDAFA